MKEHFKNLIELSEQANKNDEVPVSCMILNDQNEVIGVGINSRQQDHSVIGHAEINAILQAEKNIQDWRLDSCYMLVSLKPCVMCQYIIKESRLNKVYYLLDRNKTEEIIDTLEQIPSNEYTEKYNKILCDFFKNKRD